MESGDFRFKKGSQVAVSKDFKAYEFDCQCSCAGETVIQRVLVEKLQKLRDMVGCPIRVNSGYRCCEKQRQLAAQGYETAVGKSAHERGAAVDIMTGCHTGAELEKLARKAGFMAVGVGRNWVHVDTRDGRDRRWDYLKR